MIPDSHASAEKQPLYRRLYVQVVAAAVWVAAVVNTTRTQEAAGDRALRATGRDRPRSSGPARTPQLRRRLTQWVRKRRRLCWRPLQGVLSAVNSKGWLPPACR